MRVEPWSELFLKFKISKEITQSLSKMFKNKELIFSDVVGILPVTLLQKKYLLLNAFINSNYRVKN